MFLFLFFVGWLVLGRLHLLVLQHLSLMMLPQILRFILSFERISLFCLIFFKYLLFVMLIMKSTILHQRTAWLAIFYMCIPSGFAVGYVYGGFVSFLFFISLLNASTHLRYIPHIYIYMFKYIFFCVCMHICMYACTLFLILL